LLPRKKGYGVEIQSCIFKRGCSQWDPTTSPGSVACLEDQKKESMKCVVNWIPVVVAGLIALYLDLLWGLTGSLLDRNRSKTWQEWPKWQNTVTVARRYRQGPRGIVGLWCFEKKPVVWFFDIPIPIWHSYSHHLHTTNKPKKKAQFPILHSFSLTSILVGIQTGNRILLILTTAQRVVTRWKRF